MSHPTNIEGLAVAVSEGNPGAFSLVVALVRAGRTDVVAKMGRLGITGPRAWLAFKDLGDGTIDTLIANVESADITQRLADLGYACPEVPQ